MRLGVTAIPIDCVSKCLLSANEEDEMPSTRVLRSWPSVSPQFAAFACFYNVNIHRVVNFKESVCLQGMWSSEEVHTVSSLRW